MFRIVIGLGAAGIVGVGGMALLVSVLTYVLIPILGVLGGIIGFALD